MQELKDQCLKWSQSVGDTENTSLWCWDRFVNVLRQILVYVLWMILLIRRGELQKLFYVDLFEDMLDNSVCSQAFSNFPITVKQGELPSVHSKDLST